MHGPMGCRTRTEHPSRLKTCSQSAPRAPHLFEVTEAQILDWIERKFAGQWCSSGTHILGRFAQHVTLITVDHEPGLGNRGRESSASIPTVAGRPAAGPSGHQRSIVKRRKVTGGCQLRSMNVGARCIPPAAPMTAASSWHQVYRPADSTRSITLGEARCGGARPYRFHCTL